MSTGLGTGKSDAFQVGAFGSQRFGAAYISGILAYSYHRMTTDRTVTIAGADHLRASFDAHNWGGRIEGGYRLATPVVGITPYGAYQAQWVHTPSYSETVVSGTPAFALSYDAKTTSTNRVEAGVWFDKSFAFYDRTTIGLRVRGAWAHDRSSDPNINATFQSVPGASFTVNGAKPASDLGLASIGCELRRGNISLAVRLDGEFASRSQTYAGLGTFRYIW